MIKLEDAFFGYTTINPNSRKIELQELNLFWNLRVKRSIAVYKTRQKELEKEEEFDPLRFCFGDTSRRTEYEFLIRGHYEKDKPELFDVYELYVLPNRKLLMDIVNNISVASCEKYLKELDEEREKWKATK